MSLGNNILQELLKGGLIRIDSSVMTEAFKEVSKTLSLVPSLNNSTSVDETRQILSEIIGVEIDKSTRYLYLFTPILESISNLEKIFSSIMAVVCWILAESLLMMMCRLDLK